MPNLGDITKVDWSEVVRKYGRPDVLIGGSPCFPAGTLVLTDKRLVPIEDIKVGDMVLTHKGRYRRVLKVGSHIGDTVVLKGQGTHGLECTPNHPFLSVVKEYTWDNSIRSRRMSLSKPEWTHAEDMVGRMWLNVSASSVETNAPSFRLKDETFPYEMDEEFFYFVGRWLGDGWITSYNRKDRKNSVMKKVFICCDHRVADDLQERLRKTGLVFTRMEDRTATRFTCTSAPLHDWFLENFGKGAAGKHLPSWALGLPIKLRKALFTGYADSDGTLFDGGIKASSVSRELAVGMKMLGAGLGYTSSVVRVVNRREECVIEGRRVNERPYYSQSYYNSSRSAIVCGEGFWGRVRKVLPGREQVRVYNLEVEEDNSYAADGIVCHNCQSFSIAGGRASLDGASRLMFEYIRACREVRSPWIVWENVPGVLSARDNAFGQLVEELQQAGYVSLTWRVLDSQFFGVAQRRRRVFLVGHLGEGGHSAAVLLEQDCLRGNTSSSAEKRKALAAEARGRTAETGGCVAIQGDGQRSSGSQNGCGISTEDVGYTVNTVDRHSVSYSIDYKQTPKWNEDVCHTLTHEGQGGIHSAVAERACHDEPIGFNGTQDPISAEELSVCITHEGSRVSYEPVVGGDGRIASCLSATQFGTHENETLIAEPGEPTSFKWFAGAKARSAAVYEDGTTPTLTNSDAHQPAVMVDEPIVLASCHTNAELGVGGVSTTLLARQFKDPPIVCDRQRQATDRTSSRPSARQTETSSSSTTSPSMGEGSSSTKDGDGPEPPIVIDRAAYNQGANATYPPHIEQCEVMDTLVARGPHAIAYSQTETT